MSSDMLGRVVQKLVEVPAEALGPVLDLLMRLTGDKWQAALKELKLLLRKEEPSLQNPVAGFPSFVSFSPVAFLASWVKFYQEVHGLTIDPAAVLLPPLDQALGAGVVMVPGITIEQDLAEIRKRTPGQVLYRYTEDNLDQSIQKNQEMPRPQGGVYAVWTTPVSEATDQAPELARQSYEGIGKLNPAVPVMLFGEYVRFFLWFLWATGQPLDRRDVTLSGSLAAVGYVLRGDWRGVRFSVGWYVQRYSSGGLRARRVVLPPLA